MSMEIIKTSSSDYIYTTFEKMTEAKFSGNCCGCEYDRSDGCSHQKFGTEEFEMLENSQCWTKKKVVKNESKRY